MRPMLGGVELQHVQRLEIDGDQVLVQHGVPALEGDFLQGLGRRGAQVALAGVLTGPESGQGLKDLRTKFRAAEPVPFLADLSSATRVDQVLIEEMGVRELAGKPERFEYAFTLREYLPPAEPEVAAEQVEEGIQEQATEISSQQIDDISDALGALEVQVNLGDGGDYSRIAVVVEGATADGEPFSTRIEEETDGIYRLEDIRAGTYTVRAVVR